jgi:regulatory protein
MTGAMTGPRRGRTGRGWDAAPLRPRSVDDSSTEGSATEGSATEDSGALSWPGRRGRPGSNRADAEASKITQDSAHRPRNGAPERIQGAVGPGEQAREICLQLLSLRPRTRTELATALRRRGIPDEVAAEVLDRYSEVGIIDDEAFAKAWVTSRHHGRGLARKALAGELRRKGVKSETVGAALDDLDPAIEVATARALVERKLRSDRSAPPDALFRRLVGMLARKGYPAGLAFKVVKDLLEERAYAAALEAAHLDLAELDPDLLDAEAQEAEA